MQIIRDKNICNSVLEFHSVLDTGAYHSKSLRVERFAADGAREEARGHRRDECLLHVREMPQVSREHPQSEVEVLMHAQVKRI